MGQRSAETSHLVRADSVKITAVVATYNEERHIQQCLQTLLDQRGVPGEIEILVIDGRSTDSTALLVRAMPEYGRRIRLIENPKRLQVHAWNIGLREGSGEYFAMIVAHAEYALDYFASCLEVMERTGATAVGGVQRPFGESALGEAIAWCMSTPYGVGNASFRYAREEVASDSVFCIFTRMDVLRSLGGYDERVAFDEDSEMNYRIARSGGRLLVSPRIDVRYHVRRTLRALSKQMYRYGYWRRFTQLLHPRAVPLRALAPPALVAGLAASLLLTASPLRPLAAIVPGCYLIFLAAASMSAAKRIGWRAVCVPVALATMHASYGAGWIAGALTFRKRRATALAIWPAAQR